MTLALAYLRIFYRHCLFRISLPYHEKPTVHYILKISENVVQTLYGEISHHISRIAKLFDFELVVTPFKPRPGSELLYIMDQDVYTIYYTKKKCEIAPQKFYPSNRKKKDKKDIDPSKLDICLLSNFEDIKELQHLSWKMIAKYKGILFLFFR